LLNHLGTKIKSRPFDIIEANDGVVCFFNYHQKGFFETILSPAYSIESIKKEDGFKAPSLAGRNKTDST